MGLLRPLLLVCALGWPGFAYAYSPAPSHWYNPFSWAPRCMGEPLHEIHPRLTCAEMRLAVLRTKLGSGSVRRDRRLLEQRIPALERRIERRRERAGIR